MSVTLNTVATLSLKVAAVLEARQEPMAPWEIGRKAKLSTEDTKVVLGWLQGHRKVELTGVADRPKYTLTHGARQNEGTVD